MAEVKNTNGITLPEASAVVYTTQAPLETHAASDTAMSTIGAPISEARATMAPTMPAPEAFTSGDLAMNNNPVTTAGLQPPSGDQDSSTTNHAHSVGASNVHPELPQIHENTPVPDPLSETSTTDWLVPSAAPMTSRITFDGKLSLCLVYSSNKVSSSMWCKPLCHSPLNAICAYLMPLESDYLTLSEITFEWGDSYDDKDWMRLRAILAPTLVVCLTSSYPCQLSQSHWPTCWRTGGLHRGERAQMGVHARFGFRGHNVTHWFRGRPSGAHTTSHRRFEMAKDLRRRSDWSSPIKGGPPAIYEP